MARIQKVSQLNKTKMGRKFIVYIRGNVTILVYQLEKSDDH